MKHVMDLIEKVWGALCKSSELRHTWCSFASYYSFQTKKQRGPGPPNSGCRGATRPLAWHHLAILGSLRAGEILGLIIPSSGCITLASPDLVRIWWLLHQLPRVLEAVARYHFRRCRLLQSPYRADMSMATASRSLHDPWEPLKASCCYDLLALHHD